MAPDFAQGATSADAWSMNGPKGGVPSTASHAQQGPKPKLIPTQSAHRCELVGCKTFFTILLLCFCTAFRWEAFCAVLTLQYRGSLLVGT